MYDEQLKQAFAEMFPLTSKDDLPWAPCQIKEFLKKRIALEVKEQTRWFTTRVVQILCEQSPPKNHVEDMARIVVTKAKDSERLQEERDAHARDSVNLAKARDREKAARIYYQNIVYAVCQKLDQALGTSIVCGTVEEPSNGVQLGMDALLQRLRLPTGTIDVTDAMVDRFLTWPLPESVCADLCATRQGAAHRTGTNVLSAEEARQMLQHVLAGQ